MANANELLSPRDQVFDPFWADLNIKGPDGTFVERRIVTARPLVLSKTNVGGDTDISIFGDDVVVEGVLELHGRKISIVCRRLEFRAPLGAARVPAGVGRQLAIPVGIDVSGTTGPAGGNKKSTNAQDGVKLSAPGQANKGTLGNPAGTNGAHGANGDDGGVGGAGGTIFIWCDTLVRTDAAVLDARGGRGGKGGPGQPGGQGGDGFDGSVSDPAKATGGPGGAGGNSGNGGQGGRGGEIHLKFLRCAPPFSGMALSVAGGWGGDGGTPGQGGPGGKGGTPYKDSRYPGEPPRLLNGASGGGGGQCGLPGYAGALGDPGTMEFASARPPESRPRMDAAGHLLPYEPEQSAFESSIVNISALWVQGRRFPGPSGREEGPFYLFDVWAIFAGAEKRDNRLPVDGQAFPADKQHGAGGGGGDPAARGPIRYVQRPGGMVGPVLVEEDLHLGTRGSAGTTVDNRQPKSPPPAPGREPAERQRNNLPASSFPQLWTVVGEKDLAGALDRDQLPMLFEQCRDAYLFLNLAATTNKAHEDQQRLAAQLDWIVLVTTAVDNKTPLATASAATLLNLRARRNLFGHGPDYAAVGLLDQYKSDLLLVLQKYTKIETSYQTLAGAWKDTIQRTAYLTNLAESQGTMLTLIEDEVGKSVKRVNAALDTVQDMEATRTQRAAEIEQKLKAYETALQKDASHLTPTDVLQAVGQLAFINPEAAPLAVPLIVGQGADLASKAMTNVVTDSGATVDMHYLGAGAHAIGTDVKDIKSLKQARDGFLKADGTEEFRLMATRKQVREITDGFYRQFAVARELQSDFDSYIDLVATRSEKIDEYNTELQGLCYLKAQVRTVSEAKTQTESWAKAAPDTVALTGMANFSRALWRHARERCLETLYLASRAFRMQSLSPKDVFVDVLGKLVQGGTQPTNVGMTAINTALIELIADELKTENERTANIEQFRAQGEHCRIVLTKQKHVLVFAMLKANKSAIVPVLAARQGDDIDRTPFAGMSNVRLSAIRVMVKGMKTRDNVYTIQLTHPGVETFVTNDNREVVLSHTPLTHTYQYSPDDTADPATRAKAAQLDPGRRMIGPFCQWTIGIPKEYNAEMDLSGLEEITVDFEGTHQPFPKTAPRPS